VQSHGGFRIGPGAEVGFEGGDIAEHTDESIVFIGEGAICTLSGTGPNYSTQMTEHFSQPGAFNITSLPNECPHCHKSIHPHYIGNWYTAIERERADNDEYFMPGTIHKLYALFSCPDKRCLKPFIVLYESGSEKGNYEFQYISPGRRSKIKPIEGVIKEISPDFCEIFDEASIADEGGLTMVSGIGYRKAIEFLVKDYAIKKNPDKKAHIIATRIGGQDGVIHTYLPGDGMKNIAEKATWLGNDETHYTRTWNEFNVDVLKKLIQILVTQIEQYESIEGVLKEMSKKR
jgi:hypothetical protein